MVQNFNTFIEIDEKFFTERLEKWNERIEKIENIVCEIETGERKYVNSSKILSLLHFLLEVLYSAVDGNPEATQWLIIEDRTKNHS